jgi:hypothetical protein
MTRRPSSIAASVFALAAFAISLTSGQALAGVSQRTFDTPEHAVSALIAAAKSRNADELASVVGDDMIGQTGDPVLSDLDRALFVEAAGRSVKVEKDGESADRMIVYVGENDWPFPAPLVKDGAAWRFDGREGKQEIVDRRVGRNEIHAVETCLGYVDAQLEYVRSDHTGAGILEFAQKLMSTPGQHDGLFWSDVGPGADSPLGPALMEGPKPAPGRTLAHHGYSFRIVTAQGSNAAGGKRNFLVDGHLFGGFALIAWPNEYGVTGIQTFMINQLGVVYGKNLGPQTATAAEAIQSFDPDSSWKKLN